MQQVKRWRMLKTLFAGVFCLALLLPLFQVQAKGANSLTIVRTTKAAEVHPINQEPTGQGDPVSGAIFTLWKLGETESLSANDYSKKISELEKKTNEELTKDYPNPIPSGETGADGKVTISNLENGLYYVREKEQGQGTIVPFLVPLPLLTESGSQTDVTVYPKKLQPDTPDTPPQTPPGKIELTKTDLKGKALSGAHFHLFKKTSTGQVSVPLLASPGQDGLYRYDLAGKTDLDLISGPDGKILVTQLPAGTYIFKEVQAPVGYTVESAEKEVSVLAGKTSQLTVTNKPNETGGFRFQKIAADGKKTPLLGARFAVFVKTERGWQTFQKEGKDVILTSGADGFFALTDVPFGDYALYEITAPKGYAFTDAHIYFTVDATSYDQGKFIPIENKKTPPENPPLTPPDNPPDQPPEEPPAEPPTRPPRKPPNVNTGDPGMLRFLLLGLVAASGLALLRRKEK